MNVSINALRRSQRPTRSCQACKRRKVRCDRRIPCQSCIKHGIASTCLIEPVYLTTKDTKSRSEIEFLRELLSLVEGLETGEAQSIRDLVHRRLGLLETGRERTAPPSSPRSQPRQQNDTAETAMVLLGLGSRGRGADQESETAQLGSSERDLLLPSVEHARELVRYHDQQLCWHHNVIHTVVFEEQCEDYWTTGRIEHPMWMALYFAVLSAAAWNLPVHLCESTFGEDNLRSKADAWYQAMIQTLYDLDFLANHSLFSIQAVIVSTMIAYPLGKSYRQTILLNSCLRIAQFLGLGEQDDPPASSEDAQGALGDDAGWREIVKSQTLRRMWWQLIVQDYFLSPISGSYGISPNHFKTPIPTNCNDLDMEEQPPDQPTMASYCIVLAKMSILIPPLIDGTRNSKSPIPLEEQYEIVQQVDHQMRELAANLPVFLKPGTAQDPSWPDWVSWARTTLTISAADKIIMIHRAFLVRSFHDARYAFTRRTCVAAATTILHEFTRVQHSHIVRFCFIPTFTVGAAITLYLDIIYRPDTPDGDGESGGDDIRTADLRLVHETIAGLRRLTHDHIATRGVLVLEALVQQKARSRAVATLSAHNGALPDLAKFVPRLEGHEQVDAQMPLPASDEIAQGGNRVDVGLAEGEPHVAMESEGDVFEQWLDLNSAPLDLMQAWYDYPLFLEQ